MGDFRTVAAVSRALAHVLESALERRGMRGEYRVTIASPHHASNSRESAKSINIFLYHVRPTQSLRNNDLPVYEGGQLANVPTVGLDLYYLLSFYGHKPNDLEAERLLGVAVTALNAHPLLTQTDFNASADPDHAELGRLDTVAVTPMTLTIEEMQRLWTMFPSVPYTLSMSYRASAAVLVGDEVPVPAAPVAVVAPRVAPSPRPAVTGAGRADTAALPLTFKSSLRVVGRHLAASRVAVDIAGLRLAVKPSAVRDTELELELDDPGLRAGRQPLSVLHLDTEATTLAEARVVAASEPITVDIAPLLSSVVASVDPHQEGGDAPSPRYRGTLELAVEPSPKSGQNAGVMLNRGAADLYAFPLQMERAKLVAPFHGVVGGRYLVRVEVDGVSSLLEPQSGKPFTSPAVQIPPRRSKHG